MEKAAGFWQQFLQVELFHHGKKRTCVAHFTPSYLLRRLEVLMNGRQLTIARQQTIAPLVNELFLIKIRAKVQLILSYNCGHVERHDGMRGEQKVKQCREFTELGDVVSKPGQHPAQCKVRLHLHNCCQVMMVI